MYCQMVYFQVAITRRIKKLFLSEEAFLRSSIPLIDKLESFSRFATKRAIARFLVKQRIFEQILNINGVIVECGVFNGAGLFTWSQLSTIYEPTNYNRKIVGFDTFEGFPSVDSKDNTGVQRSREGDLRGSTLEELELSVRKHNEERYISHIPNIEFVKGDFNVTGPDFLGRNSHIIISLLYLDFDLYEPTKKALKLFRPRMPRGSIIAFDELNCDSFPGETVAFDEVLGVGNYELKRFPIDPWISYVIL